MFENYAHLVDKAVSDVTITTHLLHHQTRPTVTHILAGLQQLRNRGRAYEVQNLFDQATTWSNRNKIALVDGHQTALLLSEVLAHTFEKVETLLSLTPRTRSMMSRSLTRLPVVSARKLAIDSHLSIATARAAANALVAAELLHQEIARHEIYFISSAYLNFVESMIPVPVIQHQLVRLERPKNTSANQIPNYRSPFESIYDPFGFRANAS